MNRLIKSEIYDGFNYKENYYEVYKNPTSIEIENVKKSDPYKSIRGIIDKSGNVYIWIGEMSHMSINKYIQNNIQIDYFRFAYTNFWIIDLTDFGATINKNECKNIIKSNLDILSKIGNINSPIDIMGLVNEERYLEFESLNGFLNEKEKTSKLIKKSKFYDAFKNGDEYIEIFINPTNDEKEDIKKIDTTSSIRGTLTNSGDMYIWSGKYWHSKILDNISIPKGIHFCVYDNIMDVYIKPEDNIQIMYECFINNKNNLNILINDSAKIRIDIDYYRAKENELYKEIKSLKDIFDFNI